MKPLPNRRLYYYKSELCEFSSFGSLAPQLFADPQLSEVVYIWIDRDSKSELPHDEASPPKA